MDLLVYVMTLHQTLDFTRQVSTQGMFRISACSLHFIVIFFYCIVQSVRMEMKMLIMQVRKGVVMWQIYTGSYCCIIKCLLWDMIRQVMGSNTGL